MATPWIRLNLILIFIPIYIYRNQIYSGKGAEIDHRKTDQVVRIILSTGKRLHFFLQVIKSSQTIVFKKHCTTKRKSE